MKAAASSLATRRTSASTARSATKGWTLPEPGWPVSARSFLRPRASLRHTSATSAPARRSERHRAAPIPFVAPAWHAKCQCVREHAAAHLLLRAPVTTATRPSRLQFFPVIDFDESIAPRSSAQAHQAARGTWAVGGQLVVVVRHMSYDDVTRCCAPPASACLLSRPACAVSCQPPRPEHHAASCSTSSACASHLARRCS